MLTARAEYELTDETELRTAAVASEGGEGSDSGDIAAWHGPERYDVIVANASLPWVPDHAALLPALMRRLAPGGQLAVQMPDNLDEPVHRLMRKVAAEGPWAGQLASAGAVRAPRRQPDW